MVSAQQFEWETRQGSEHHLDVPRLHVVAWPPSRRRTLPTQIVHEGPVTKHTKNNFLTRLPTILLCMLCFRTVQSPWRAAACRSRRRPRIPAAGRAEANARAPDDARGSGLVKRFDTTLPRWPEAAAPAGRNLRGMLDHAGRVCIECASKRFDKDVRRGGGPWPDSGSRARAYRETVPVPSRSGHSGAVAAPDSSKMETCRPRRFRFLGPWGHTGTKTIEDRKVTRYPVTSGRRVPASGLCRGCGGTAWSPGPWADVERHRHRQPCVGASRRFGD
jgi:hypothetical protein